MRKAAMTNPRAEQQSVRKPAREGKPVMRAPRLDAEARAEFLAELERRMGVKPILGRTGLRPGY